MDAIKHSNDLKPTDSDGDEIQSSPLQLDSVPSNSQPTEVVNSVDSSSLQLDSVPSNSQPTEVVNSVDSSSLLLDSVPSNSQPSEVVNSVDSSSLEAQSLVEVVFDDLPVHSTPSEAQIFVGEILLNGDAQAVDNYASISGQSSYDPGVEYVENAQAVDNFTSISGQSSYDPQIAYVGNAQAVENFTSISGQSSYGPQIAYGVPLSSHSTNSFTYNGITYYSYEAYVQDVLSQFIQEMRMDGVAPRSDDLDEPQFSDSMVLATGGSPAIINPHNGLPWRKGANLCRPYIEEGCCNFGTACIFHHPWPPTEDLP